MITEEDLNTSLTLMSDEHLGMLLAKVKRELARREVKKMDMVRQKIQEVAANAGFSVDELLPGAHAHDRRRNPVAVKYRHPQDPSLTWTGRGRMALWIKKELENGKTLEDFAVA